jgi:hypothetical protein
MFRNFVGSWSLIVLRSFKACSASEAPSALRASLLKFAKVIFVKEFFFCCGFVVWKVFENIVFWVLFWVCCCNLVEVVFVEKLHKG